MKKLLASILLLVLGVATVGFGACGTYGVVASMMALFQIVPDLFKPGNHTARDAISGLSTFVIMGALGLMIAWGAYKAMRTIWRNNMSDHDES